MAAMVTVMGSGPAGTCGSGPAVPKIAVRPAAASQVPLPTLANPGGQMDTSRLQTHEVAGRSLQIVAGSVAASEAARSGASPSQRGAAGASRPARTLRAGQRAVPHHPR
jgi:hypothetical protein